MDIEVIEQGKADAGVITGGERTLQVAPDPSETPAAPPPEAPPKTLTDAELEARRKEIAETMWGNQTKPKVTTEKPNEPPTPAAPPPTAATPPAVVAPEPPKAAPTTEEVIRETAKAVGAEVSKAIATQKPEPPASPAAVVPELTPEDSQDYAIIQKMEALNPAMRGKAEAFKEFALARYEYETRWQEEHPGATFDPEDSDHAEFYKRQPEFDTDAFDAARIALMVDKQVDERMAREVKPKLDAIENERLLEKALPKIAQAVQDKVFALVDQVNPDLAKLLKDEKGQIQLGEAQITAVTEADPIAASVLDAMVKKELTPMIAALERSLLPGEQNELKPAENAVHRQIGNYLRKYETAMEQKPPTEQLRDGRSFLSVRDRNLMLNDILAGAGSKEHKEAEIKKLDSRYWTPTVDDLQDFIVKDISARAKRDIEAIEAVAAKKYKGRAANPAPTPVAAPTSPSAPATPPNTRSKPPGLPPSSEVVDTSRANNGGQKSFGEIAVETHWRK